MTRVDSQKHRGQQPPYTEQMFQVEQHLLIGEVSLYRDGEPWSCGLCSKYCIFTSQLMLCAQLARNQGPEPATAPGRRNRHRSR